MIFPVPYESVRRSQTYDYGEIIEIDEATAQETLKKAKSFVEEIEKYVQSQNVQGEMPE